MLGNVKWDSNYEFQEFYFGNSILVLALDIKKGFFGKGHEGIIKRIVLEDVKVFLGKIGGGSLLDEKLTFLSFFAFMKFREKIL